VASLNAPFEGLKAAKTADGSINFVVNTLAHWGNGTAYNSEMAPTPKTSGQLYDAGFVRHWNYYITEQRYAVFSGVLSKGNGSYSFNGETTNLLKGINSTVTKPESPVQGSSSNPGDYDISPDGTKVAFLSKSPDLPKANYTASYIYVVPHDGSEVAVAINGPGTTAPSTAQGASGYPVWSHDSSKLAFGQQDGISYESDRFKLYVADVALMMPISGLFPSSMLAAACGLFPTTRLPTSPLSTSPALIHPWPNSTSTQMARPLCRQLLAGPAACSTSSTPRRTRRSSLLPTRLMPSLQACCQTLLPTSGYRTRTATWFRLSSTTRPTLTRARSTLLCSSFTAVLRSLRVTTGAPGGTCDCGLNKALSLP
jgi:hypothetical protein